MSSITCSQCGLVNFLSAEQCKRCKATLTTPPTDKPRPTLSKGLTQYAGNQSPDKPLPTLSKGLTQYAGIPPPDKPLPTLSKSLTQDAGKSEKEPVSYVLEPAPYVPEPARRMRLSPLRILVVILLLLGGCWYQMQKWDAERAATLKADKEFDEKRKENEPAPALDDLH